MSPLLLVALLSAAEPEALSRFEHARHEKVLAREGLACSACHQVGGSLPGASAETLDEVFMMPGAQACHSCHRPERGDRRSRAPSRCQTCHAAAPAPTDHGAGWLSLHGQEARMGVQSCSDCHRDAFCVDCHENKESIRFEVHDRSWLSVHGIAARAQPAECSTCHVQAECVSCHSSGASPW
jgi:hypothetical protein